MTENAIAQRSTAPARAQLPEELAGFVGERPLIRGEDPERYDALFGRIADAVGPQDALEWLWVADITSAAWESHRARRLRAQLVEVTRKEAIQSILVDLLQHEITGMASRRQHCHAMAIEWLQDTPDGEAKMRAFLAGYGLGPEAVTAEIYRLRADVFERIDRMAAAADRRRDLVIREIERRRRDRAERFRQASDEIIGREEAQAGENGWFV